jgi:hypothetical protein
MYLQEAKGKLINMLKTRLRSNNRYYDRILDLPAKDLDVLCKDSKTAELCAKIKEEKDSYIIEKRRNERFLEKMSRKRKDDKK